jgi:general secretion pathway protein N
MAPRRVPERPDRAAPQVARRPWWLIAVGLAAALLIAVATLPAQVFAGRLQRAGIEAAAFSGTIWNGRAQALAWRSAPLGDLAWSIAPLEVLRGRVGGELQLTRPDGRLSTHASLSLGGTLRLADTTADLPVELLAALPVGMPRNWRGRLSGTFAEITVAKGWPTAIRGTLEMDGMIAPPPRNVSIGSYHVEMPDPAASDTTDGVLSARVTDKEGPLSFEGRLTLSPDRSFLLEGTVAPRGTTPPPLAQSLQFLGPPDANGRRPVSVSGTL